MEETVVAEAEIFDEAAVLKYIRRWRWVSVKVGSYQLLAMNWVVSLLASAVLLGFVIASVADPAAMAQAFRWEGQPWITQNFTWFYILTQDVWVLFLLYIGFTKYGAMKLGKDNEAPKYNDLTWFCMLFCCGIAVGFFVFGVGEPLYYYRQPTYWKGSWAYDYNLRKIQIEDDDQRANQAIFMCLFHWGVHGWIPYVLIAVNAGLVTHRWGLPLTIRSLFYPLIGDHIFSFIGDCIDALSMACTTFGVCTSLGLGAQQLSSGLQYMERYFTDGRSARITADTSTYVGLIWGITIIAAFSVVTGLNKGLKYLSMLAMTICLILLLFALFADSTAYLMNIFVQTMGYYFNYLIQAGFDCEAFQQLGYEFDAANALIKTAVPAVVEAVAPGTPFTGGDCGTQLNPCTKGAIYAGIYAFSNGMSLKALGVSAADVALGAAVFGLTPAPAMIPCGAGYNATNIDAAMSAAMGAANYPEHLPAAYGAALPGCPTDTFDKTAAWGTCEAYKHVCTKYQALFDSTNRKFMDWWTIFYWGWWVSWGPFVGIFIATISRGRTIRSVIVGAFVMPMFFSFSWFSVFGGLAIKMERVAEYALDVKPDWENGLINCDDHYSPTYSGGVPTSAAAIALEGQGYYMLACRPFVTQIYDVMRPYTEYAPFMLLLLWVGLFFYFITSSDSGSYVDDLLGASGLSHPPALQKVYWAFTEGAVASVLVAAAGDSGIANILKGLRSVSICSGFPLTFLLCLCMPATYRALKREDKDPAIHAAHKFNSQLFDFCELYRPRTKGPYWGQTGTNAAAWAKGLVLPGYAVFVSLRTVDNHKVTALVLGTLAQCLFLVWLVLHFVQIGVGDSASLGWTAWCFMVAILGYTRARLRIKYNIWGNMVEDMWCALTMWPWVAAQCELQAKNEGAGSPKYFDELDAMQAGYDMAGAKGDTTSTSTV